MLRFFQNLFSASPANQYQPPEPDQSDLLEAIERSLDPDLNRPSGSAVQIGDDRSRAQQQADQFLAKISEPGVLRTILASLPDVDPDDERFTQFTQMKFSLSAELPPL
jgi:hypothetical protein